MSSAVDRDEQDFKTYLAGTNLNDVDLGGEIGNGDYFELVQTSALIAKVCGMGGCRSLTEFVDMINNEDPALLNSMQVAISFMLRRMYGDAKYDKKGRELPNTERMFGDLAEQTKASGNIVLPAQNRVGYAAEQTDLMNIIKHHGVSASKLCEIKKKISQGEIQVSNREFGDLTGQQLASMSKDKFEELLNNMNDHVKHSVNFKLDMSNFNPFGGSGGN